MTARLSSRASRASPIAMRSKTWWKKAATLRKWCSPARFAGTLRTASFSTATRRLFLSKDPVPRANRSTTAMEPSRQDRVGHWIVKVDDIADASFLQTPSCGREELNLHDLTATVSLVLRPSHFPHPPNRIT